MEHASQASKVFVAQRTSSEIRERIAGRPGPILAMFAHVEKKFIC